MEPIGRQIGIYWTVRNPPPKDKEGKLTALDRHLRIGKEGAKQRMGGACGPRRDQEPWPRIFVSRKLYRRSPRRLSLPIWNATGPAISVTNRCPAGKSSAR